jgi:hypothetical protein
MITTRNGARPLSLPNQRVAMLPRPIRNDSADPLRDHPSLAVLAALGAQRFGPIAPGWGRAYPRARAQVNTSKWHES